MRTRYMIGTDFHFGHDKLIEYNARPENFTERIINNCLNELQRGDVFIFLGDYCIGNDKIWHEKFLFNIDFCKKILVRGNHDRCTDTWYLNHGWDFVCDSLHIKRYGKDIMFTHRPVSEQALDILGCDVNVHGHLHSNKHRIEDSDYDLLTWRHILVKMEHGYRLQELQKLINKKEQTVNLEEYED